MVVISRASQSCSRCSMAEVDASAASFHPSKAAMATGERKVGSPSNSVTPPPYGLSRRSPPWALHGARVPRSTLHVRWTAGPTSLGHVTNRDFRSMLADRVLIADGAMGTMLQAADPTLDDFDGYEGCNEILNVTRPDIVRGVHDAYFEAG